MVKYENSIIYKLCCKDVSIKEIYIGSTTNFSRRKCEHKSNCTNINSVKYNLNVYNFIRSNGDWDNWDMIEIEKYQATDKRNLETRERYFVETLCASLNTYIPTRSQQEWRDENKVKLAKNSKTHYIENTQKYLDKSSSYYKNNKDLVNARKKNIYEKNKYSINLQSRNYYQDNKEKIKLREMEIVNCDCGADITKGNKHSHLKTLKHIFWKTIYDFIYS